MTEHTFKTGDVVQLVSGGPRMTVEDIRTDGLIACIWFADTHLQRDAFDPVALQSSRFKVVHARPSCHRSDYRSWHV